MAKKANIVEITKDTIQNAFSDITGSEENKKGGQRSSHKKQGSKSQKKTN